MASRGARVSRTARRPTFELRRPDGARKDSMSTEHHLITPGAASNKGLGLAPSATTWRGCRTHKAPLEYPDAAMGRPAPWRLTWGDYCIVRLTPQAQTRGAPFRLWKAWPSKQGLAPEGE